METPDWKDLGEIFHITGNISNTNNKRKKRKIELDFLDAFQKTKIQSTQKVIHKSLF